MAGGAGGDRTAGGAVVHRCRFATERLSVGPWHEAGDDELIGFVVDLLGADVGTYLPPSWQGPLTRASAGAWVAARDAEGPVLLVRERSSGDAVGLVVLFAEGLGPPASLRVGYVLAREHWGRGLATEVVRGLVAWSGTVGVDALDALVSRGNAASMRVLIKAGFVEADGAPSSEVVRFVWPA